jgi:hypothetical protein
MLCGRVTSQMIRKCVKHANYIFVLRQPCFINFIFIWTLIKIQIILGHKETPENLESKFRAICIRYVPTILCLDFVEKNQGFLIAHGVLYGFMALCNGNTFLYAIKGDAPT